MPPSPEPSANVPDLMTLIPEGDSRQVILYCLNTLNLSVWEAEEVLTAAPRLISSLDWLLRGGDFLSTLE